MVMGKNYSSCEICGTKNDVEKILGDHLVCLTCKKGLRLPKDETMLEWNKIETSNAWSERKKFLTKKIIRLDYILDFLGEK